MLYGMTKNRSAAWGDIAAVTVKLREGSGESPSSFALHAQLRAGGTLKHTVNFVEAEMLPWFARDIRDAAAALAHSVRSEGLARTPPAAAGPRRPGGGGAEPRSRRGTRSAGRRSGRRAARSPGLTARPACRSRGPYGGPPAPQPQPYGMPPTAQPGPCGTAPAPYPGQQQGPHSGPGNAFGGGGR
ncbi:hypothetical protein ACU686_32170 [Yinghuangia aomiensis]